MKKMPTIFERDWSGDRSRVLDLPNSAAQWVFDGEGTATQKIDGACCLIRDGILYKRREATYEAVKNGIPGFELIDTDPITRKCVGWVPVGDAPEDRWFREGRSSLSATPPGGTYELVGPKVSANPEGFAKHMLVNHEHLWIAQPPRTFDALREWLSSRDIEGIVWHHEDGRMAKIKLKDFGLKRAKVAS